MDPIDGFIKRFASRPKAGATTEELSALEHRLGMKFPPDFRKLYLRSNGFTVKAPPFKVLSLRQVEQYVLRLEAAEVPRQWGYLPFTDSNDSDPYCVCSREPIEGCVVRLYHDGVEPSLDFRTLGSFLSAIELLIGDDYDPHLDDLKSDFPVGDPRRSVEDQHRAERLLDIGRSLEAGSRARAEALLFAARLMSARQAKLLGELLYENEPVQRAAKSRLREFGSIAAAALANRFEAEMGEFTASAVTALIQAGIEVRAINGGSIRLEPGPVWLKLDSFFASREDGTSIARLVEKARTFLLHAARDRQTRRR